MSYETGNRQLDACTVNEAIPATYAASYNGFSLFPQGIIELQAELMHPAHQELAMHIADKHNDEMPPLDELLAEILAYYHIPIDAVVPIPELAREVAIFLYNTRSRIKYVPSNMLALYGSTVGKESEINPDIKRILSA